jgi:hypothetical protein
MITQAPAVGTLLEYRHRDQVMHYLVIGETRWALQLRVCEIPLYHFDRNEVVGFHINCDSNKTLHDNCFFVLSELTNDER